jgi:hypothetical protein
MLSYSSIGNISYISLHLIWCNLWVSIDDIYITLSQRYLCVSSKLDDIRESIILKWDQPDLNRRPPAPEAGIIPS